MNVLAALRCVRRLPRVKPWVELLTLKLDQKPIFTLLIGWINDGRPRFLHRRLRSSHKVSPFGSLGDVLLKPMKSNAAPDVGKTWMGVDMIINHNPKAKGVSKARGKAASHAACFASGCSGGLGGGLSGGCGGGCGDVQGLP